MYILFVKAIGILDEAHLVGLLAPGY
jgi:hypothetical protein